MTALANSATPTRNHPGITLFVVCMAVLIVPLGISGTSATLPEIGARLDADLVPLQWAVNSYNIVAASLMLVAGSFSDRFGRRRIFTLGTGLYALSLLVTVFATNIYVVDVARGFAGLGATGIMTAGTAILASTFDGAARARAFGLLGVTIGAGLALGPTSSGLLVGAFGWRAVFVAHLVIVVASMVGLPFVAESRGPGAGRVDWAGVVTFTASLVLFTLAIISGPQYGWGSGRVIGLFAASAVVLVVFALVERGRPDPMLDLSLLRNKAFISVNLLNVGISVGFVALLVVLPAYFISATGASARSAGLTMLLMTGPILVSPLLAGRLVARGVPVRVMLSAGMLIIAAGCLGLTVVSPQVGILALAGPLLLIGVGMGAMVGLLDGAAVSTVEPARAGMAAGMFNTVRLASEAVAVVGMVAIVVSVVRPKIADGLGRFPDQQGNAGDLANQVVGGDVSGLPGGAFRTFLAEAHTSGVHVAVVACAVFCAVAAVLAFALLRERRVSGLESEAVPERVSG